MPEEMMVALKLEGPIPDDELLGKASEFAKDAAEREVKLIVMDCKKTVINDW